MDARNRMHDVIKLRCNILQDFLSLIIKPDWKEPLYQIARESVMSGKNRNSYLEAYEIMRDKGIENYSILDMDVSFIATIILYNKNLLNVALNKSVEEGIKEIRKDRNLTNHSNENEDDNELYLRQLISLCDLKDLIRNIDNSFDMKGKDLTAEFRKNSLKKIDDLMELIDDERISLIQKYKLIKKDCDMILNEKDQAKRLKIKLDVEEKYRKMLDINPKENREDWYDFYVFASDYGIHDFDEFAASIYFHRGEIKKATDKYIYIIENYSKWNEERTKYFANDFLYTVNAHHFNEPKIEINDDIKKVFELIESKGFKIKTDDDGRYCLETKDNL